MGGNQLRFQTQSACLAQAYNGFLPPESIVAHMIVNHDVLLQHSKEQGLVNTSDLFPDRKNDYILDALLSIPWVCANPEDDFPIPIFIRGLSLPEYDLEFVKHLPPNITLFSSFWIADQRTKNEAAFSDIPFYKIEEQAYYANLNEGFELHEIDRILSKHPSFVVELDNLIKVPEIGNTFEFEKGIIISKENNDMISVSGLIVEHPGHTIRGIGANQGWYYKIKNGIWEKVYHENQCPCNNDLRHELQFSLLRILNHEMKEQNFVHDDDLNYRHKSLASA